MKGVMIDETEEERERICLASKERNGEVLRSKRVGLDYDITLSVCI